MILKREKQGYMTMHNSTALTLLDNTSGHIIYSNIRYYKFE